MYRKIFVKDEKQVISNADNDARTIELSNDLMKYYEDCLNLISNSKGYTICDYIPVSLFVDLVYFHILTPPNSRIKFLYLNIYY